MNYDAAVLGAAFLFLTLAVSRKNGGAALGILIMSMLVWPEFLRTQIGLIQMSVPRFVAIALLIKFVLTWRHRRISFGKADALCVLLWAWTILANILSNAEYHQVTEVIGRGFDTVLMYFVARLALVNREDVPGMFEAIGISAIVMCFNGIYQATSWTSPYIEYFSAYYGGFYPHGGIGEIRHGLMRAQGSTSQPIFFGMAMMLVTGLLWSIRGYVNRQFAFKIVLLAALVAVLSTMSSGPWIALASLIGANWYFNRPHLIKPTLYLILVLIIAAQIASNRNFYDLIDHINLGSGDAYYRSRLLDVAISHWQDYWIVGKGSNSVEYWGRLIDGRKTVDIVNHFIIIALNGGVPALLFYLSMHIIAIRRSITAFQANDDIASKKLIFGLAATLVALDFSSMSVGLWGPVLLLSFILVGLMISATAWRRDQEGDLVTDQIGNSEEQNSQC